MIARVRDCEPLTSCVQFDHSPYTQLSSGCGLGLGVGTGTGPVQLAHVTLHPVYVEATVPQDPE